MYPLGRRMIQLQPAAAVGPLETILRDGRVEAIDYCTSEDGVLSIDDAMRTYLNEMG